MLVLAALYAGGGWAGSFLAIPPGYSSALWLPAGIAVMGLLARGRGLWPGVLLGSFVVNVIISAKAAGFGAPILPFVPLALGIALGSTLQAVVGAALVRRFVGYPTGCFQARESVLLLGLSGPVSCLISASAGVGLLAATGTIPHANIPFAWFNWYVGDSIGVLVVAPLFLVLLGEPASVWRRRRLQVALPMGVSLLGVLGTFLIMGRQEDQRIRAGFERKADDVQHRIQTALDEHLTILGLARAHFDATERVDRQGFGRFMGEVLAANPTFQAVEWVPKVAGSEQATFEAAIRRQDPGRAGGFRILERMPDKLLGPAAERASYFPVTFLEPFRGNEQALGFDLASEPRRWAAMARALETGRAAATEGVTLAQEHGDQTGVLVFMPVFRAGELQGFVLGVFRVGDLIGKSLAGLDLSQVRFQVREASGQLLAASASAGEGAGLRVAAPFRCEVAVSVADRPWTVSFEPTLAFLDASRTPLPWLVQAVGLFLTGALGLFLLEMSIHKELLAQKEAQEAKAESQALLQGIIDAATEFSIISTDLDGTITLFSPGAERMLGYRAADLVGVATPRLIHLESELRERQELLSREDRKPVAGFDVLVHRPRQGEAEGLEWTYLRKDGTPVPVHLVVTPIRDAQGRTTGFLGIAKDIRERLLAEEQRRANEAERLVLEHRLEQAERMESLGVLAGGVAHDMNNVLGAILGLATANQEPLDPESRTYRALDTIAHAAERGGELVKSLLGFARQAPVEEKTLAVNELLAEGIHLLERTTFSKVRLELDLAEDLHPIQGDGSALSHAFMNLFVNAVDAMADKGSLSVATRNLGPDRIEVQVRDSGCGMPPEVLKKAIEPFFTTKGLGKGTGLGLALVYSTVKAHQGELEISSEPGEGTLVTMRFPVGRREPGVLDGPEAGPPERTGFRLEVLLVDDDEMMQASSEAMLEALGHRVILAASGEEALGRVEAGLRLDAILLDMNMPGLGGAATLPRLRALCPGVPILLATGRADQAAMDLCEAHPQVSLLPKPFTMGQLKLRLEQVAGA